MIDLFKKKTMKLKQEEQKRKEIEQILYTQTVEVDLSEVLSEKIMYFIGDLDAELLYIKKDFEQTQYPKHRKQKAERLLTFLNAFELTVTNLLHFVDFVDYDAQILNDLLYETVDGVKKHKEDVHKAINNKYNIEPMPFITRDEMERKDFDLKIENENENEII